MDVFIIHGIGINKPDYADDLIKGIKTEFNNRVTKAVKEHKDYAQDLDFHPIVWDHLLGPRQKELAEEIRENVTKFAQPIKGNLWDKILVFLVRMLNGWLKGDFAAQFIMDIISYGNQDTRGLIFGHIENELNKSQGKVNSKSPMTIICHSLGTVIAADFIRDRQAHQGHVHNGFELVNFFTMGSPVRLFSLQYGDKPPYKSPVRCENQEGQWINIFDKDDPVAYRLKEINENYKEAVFEDREVEAGISVNSHIGYWDNQEVHRVIAHKLAEDWLKQRNKQYEH